MTSQRLKKLNLPDAPGVYIFKDAKKRPLYIGRATSLKDRVKSYFGIDLIATRGPRIVDMVVKAASVDWQETDSVLEAILLESVLIKRYQPHYNVDERDDKSSNYVIITREAWPRVFLARARDFDAMVKDGRLDYKIKKRFGPYPESGLIKEALKIMRKLFPFKDKKSFDPRHDAFYQALGRSPNGDDESARLEYERTIGRLILFFEGKKRRLKSDLKKQMNAAAKGLAFEEAGRLKRLMYALDHINDMALIKRAADSDRADPDRRDFRIEAYDVAHLSGTEVVGAMTVSVNGEAAPAEYRKFKISRDTNDDAAALTEMLGRRLDHPEWAFPELIVVDGNHIQVNAAERVLKARRIGIPIVAVTKNERHKADRLLGDPVLIKRYERAIIAANAEAHRSAIAYHRLRRRKSGLA